jgi:hypothetical protein
VTEKEPGQIAYEAGPLGWVSRGIWPPVPWEELTPEDHAWWDRVISTNRNPWPDWALIAGARQETAAVRELLAEILADLKTGSIGHRVAGRIPDGWGAGEYQVALWRQRAKQAGVEVP